MATAMWIRVSLIFVTVLGALAGALVGGIVGCIVAAHRAEDDLALLVLWVTVPTGAGIGGLIGMLGARRYLHD
jgi:hypothetical protein